MSQRKDRINRAFGGAADRYAHTAKLQRVTAGILADRIGGFSLPAGPRILEIGCGTGFLTELLRKTLGDAHWTPAQVAVPASASAL